MEEEIPMKRLGKPKGKISITTIAKIQLVLTPQIISEKLIIYKISQSVWLSFEVFEVRITEAISLKLGHFGHIELK